LSRRDRRHRGQIRVLLGAWRGKGLDAEDTWCSVGDSMVGISWNVLPRVAIHGPAGIRWGDDRALALDDDIRHGCPFGWRRTRRPMRRRCDGEEGGFKFAPRAGLV